MKLLLLFWTTNWINDKLMDISFHWIYYVVLYSCCIYTLKHNNHVVKQTGYYGYLMILISLSAIQLFSCLLSMSSSLLSSHPNGKQIVIATLMYGLSFGVLMCCRIATIVIYKQQLQGTSVLSLFIDKAIVLAVYRYVKDIYNQVFKQVFKLYDLVFKWDSSEYFIIFMLLSR